ncbi:CrcB family protein [Bacillus sp. RO3]|nr:CrcB family protein [Bacillus sp. RO3]
MSKMRYFLVGIGGTMGSVSRWSVSYFLTIESGFPFATLTANLLGSFLLAYFYSKWSAKNEKAYLLIATGFLGSFTTFSTLSIELLAFLIEKQWVSFLIYFAFTSMGGLLFAWIGFVFGRKRGGLVHGG